MVSLSVWYLIILREPAGSGKDTMGNRLVKKLGGDNRAHLLDLDVTGSLRTIHSRS